MSEWKKYRKTGIAEMKPLLHKDWNPRTLNLSVADRANGHPKMGDMLARDPLNHSDRWVVSGTFFRSHYVPLEESPHD